jgi:carboxyl-terminal processing protease
MYGKRAFSSTTISLNEFTSTYNEIVDNYYQEIDKDKLLEAGISGMIKYLGDPYSTYMNKDDAENFNEDVDGTYQGIGAEIKYNDAHLPMIGKVFENSPAEKSGLKENDILLKVNGEDVTKKGLSDIANLVKGDKDTTVNITIKRDGEEQEIILTRAVVDNISVTSEIIEENGKKIGYIYISIFASNTTKQFENELKILEEDHIDSLIIDVRGNSGGYLTTVTDIISLFIPKGETIYQLKTKDKVEVITYKTDESRKYPVVILADGGSASASEVLVGAFSETYHAKIVGAKTFGKGRVQKVFTLSSGALFKYTYQEWLTPKGNYIDRVGITPDVEVSYKYISDGKDTQKDKAIEILSN